MITIVLLAIILYAWVYRDDLQCIQKNSLLLAPALVPLIAAGVSAGAKALHANSQRRKAKKLKESTFVPPELLMNRDLAMQQAYSREAPGSAKAAENIRRGQANALSAIQRNAGGDTGKIAAGSVATQQAAQDAFDRLNSQGQEFSEGAFGRVYGSNLAIAGQKTRNRDQLNQAKVSLLRASDQNYMSAFNDLMSGAMASAYLGNGNGGFGGGGAGATTTNYGNVPTDSYGRFFPSMRNPY